MKDTVFQALVEAAKSKEPVALGLISGVKGSSPQKLGAKALFYNDGRIQGTLGGGCLEAEIQKRALQALRTQEPASFDLLLDHDFGWDDGLICGGKVQGLILPNAQTAGEPFWVALSERRTSFAWGIDKNFAVGFVDSPAESSRSALASSDLLYFEKVLPPSALWIAGAGHIAQAVAPLALQLDFEVIVFDDRPALANHRFFPEEVGLRADTWERLLETPAPSAASFALIVTRGHRHDALVLRNWIQKPFLFLGMIGSARKARIIIDHFREEKLATPEQLSRVACPVGIPIRSQTVPEIAISIMAQFIEKRAQLTLPEPY